MDPTKKHIKIEFDYLLPDYITGEQLEETLSDVGGEIKYVLGGQIYNFKLVLEDVV